MVPAGCVPQIFFCGFQSKDIDALPFADDPRHWIRIVLHAVEELHTRGYKYIYLILDDQGPLDLCHAVHLNKTIAGLSACSFDRRDMA